MSSHGVGHTVGHDGVLRRLVIVAALTAVLIVLPDFRVVTDGASIDPSGMVALGGVILAAYAIEHRARLYTNDADFSRFPGLEWENPLAGMS